MADTAKTTVVVPPQSPDERAAELADIRKWRAVLVVAAVVFVILTIGLPSMVLDTRRAALKS